MSNAVFGCQSCRGSGVIVASEKSTGYLYAFKCSCGTNAHKVKLYPMWVHSHGYKYTADFIPPIPDRKAATADRISVKIKPVELTEEKDIIKKELSRIDEQVFTIQEDDIPF